MDWHRALTLAERTALGPEPAAWPPWISELADFSGPSTTGLEPLAIPAEVATAAGFVELVRPFLDRARLRLKEDLEALVRESRGPLPFTAGSALRLASGTLPYRLLPLLSRTLVLELHVARLQGLLPGDTSGERFAAFLDRLRDPDAAQAILREYPVLARQALLDLTLFREVTAEVFSRLAADWAVLVERIFGGQDPGPLTGLDGGAGDRHRRGRSVRILSFASGARLVYKPRSLAVEAHFQELLAWVNAQGGHPGLRTLAVLDRGDHGWMEFAAAEPCDSPAAVARFHERLGGLLALLYSLAATDCHYENLIAAGEHPVVVDLESLFHPQVQRGRRPRPEEELRSQFALHSVLRVGLLPFQVGQGQDFEGVDISGVAAVDGQPTPEKVIQWQGTGTDEMRVIRERVPMEGGRNRPVLDGRPAQVGEYREEMTRGFTAVYRLLAGRRPELEREIARFARDPVRVVLRPTQIYGLLLQESFHPDYLRDALDRDKLFDRLGLELESQPNLARVIPAEHRDLSEGDVPFFSTFPSSRDLWTSRGERIPDFLAEPSFELVRHRIGLLGEEDLRRQLWLLRLSLGTQLLNRDDTEWNTYQPDPAAPRLSPEELHASLIRHARAVGAWFAEMAVREGDYASWIGLEFRDKRWSLEPTPDDLYAGLPGIALFLGFLGEIAQDPAATALARGAIATLLLQIEAWSQTEKGPASIGAFQGWGGTVWTLAHLGRLWQDRDLLATAERMVDRIPPLLPHDQDLDLIGGSAGAILGLLALHEACGSARALDVAIQCGERLLTLAEPWGPGLGWRTRLASEQPLAGISHGVGGIALALTRLGAVTGDARFLDAGLAGFAGERGKFWGDLDRLLRAAAGGEKPPPESTVAVAWCYGAPGVGLTRLAALPHARGDEERAALRQEIEHAVHRTLQRGPGQNHCLCHGDLGNLDFLLQAEELLPSPELAAGVQRFLEMVLASLDRDGWLCGTRGSIESPGLMNGFAGIGLGLLRLAEPGWVPSVLALVEPASPPPTACRTYSSPR